jgi:transposase
MSIREISRRTGLARNTVKKHLRSEESEPSYQRRATPSKLDPYAEKLATWLVIEATKSRKQRRNLKQIYTAISLKPETTVIGSKTALQRLNPRRRRSRTYPHREHIVLTKRVGQDLMEKLG